MPGLLDSYQIQFASNPTSTSATPTTKPPRRAYATAPQRRVRPRPSPRTQRIAGASAIKLSSQESLDYDQWLMKKYTDVSLPKSPNMQSTSPPYDPANSMYRNHRSTNFQVDVSNPVQNKNNSNNNRNTNHNHNNHMPLNNTQHLAIQPWQDNIDTDLDDTSTRSNSPAYEFYEDPDRFGHVHAQKYTEKHPNNTNNISALVPNSKAKKQVLKILSESVLQRKKQYNGLVIRREELKRIRDTLNSSFLDKLDIRFNGLAFEALPFEEALGIQTVVDQRLHAHFHGLLCKYLFDLCGEPEVTSLIEEVDYAFHSVSLVRPVPNELEQLFRNTESTVETILISFQRDLMENRIKRQVNYKSKMTHILKRHREECRIARDNMTILESIVVESTDELGEIHLNYEKSMKGIEQINLEVEKRKRILSDRRKSRKIRLEKSKRQVADDKQWQEELEKIQAKTKKIAKSAASKSRTSAMKSVSKTQTRKKTLLMAEQMYQSKRLGPYKLAADKIFHATGVDSVDKILSTFQDQSKKESLMTELTEEKECEKADKTVLLGRLKKVLQRGMVAGIAGVEVHTNKADGNIEGVEASLDHAAKGLLVSTEKVVQREKLANSCKAGVSSLCFKLGISEKSGGNRTPGGSRKIMESLDRLETVLVGMLEASYKTVGETKYVALNYEQHWGDDRPGDRAPIQQQIPPTSPVARIKDEKEDHDVDHHPYETELRKRMMSMEGLDTALKSPCDSPNNIRISPTKKLRHNFTLNVKDGKLTVEKIRSAALDLEEEERTVLHDDQNTAKESDGNNQMQSPDMLPHLLGPSDLESFLLDTIGEYNPPIKSSSRSSFVIQSDGSLISPSATAATTAAATGADVDAASISLPINQNATSHSLTESNHPVPTVPPRRPKRSRDEAVKQMKWSTAVIVDSYRKKLKNLKKEAKLAKSEGRFDDANFIESSPVPKLRTRTHTHQLTALHQALVDEKTKQKKQHGKRKKNTIRISVITGKEVQSCKSPTDRSAAHVEENFLYHGKRRMSLGIKLAL